MKQKEKLLYINNYNCSILHREESPDNHLWAAERLSELYDVTCAEVPEDFIKIKFKGVSRINNFYKSLKMLIRYFRYPIVYSACGDLTTAFAMANKIHLGKRRLYMIQHHGGRQIPFAKCYSKIMFISSFVANKYHYLRNLAVINWGGRFEVCRAFSHRGNRICIRLY